MYLLQRGQYHHEGSLQLFFFLSEPDEVRMKNAEFDGHHKPVRARLSSSECSNLLDPQTDDYRPLVPRTSPRSNRHWRLAAGCVLTADLIERCAFYGISTSTVLFCSSVLGYSSTTSVTINMVFTGACYLLCLMGGWLADSLLGRFNTAYLGLLIYLVGGVLLPAAALNYREIYPTDSDGLSVDLTLGYRQSFYLFGISLVALGSGFLRANNSPLGAAQVDSRGQNTVNSFFHWYYWFGNIGAMLAYTVIAYVMQEVNYGIGYLVTAASLLLTTMTFLLPRSKYIDQPNTGGLITRICEIVKEGVHRKRYNTYKDGSCLNNAKASSGGSFPDRDVEAVEAVFRMAPIFLTFILYWTISSQIYNTYLVQGMRMNLQWGNLKLPAASLSLYNSLVIMCLVPLVDRIIFPIMDKCNKRPTQLQRIGFGMVLACLSMVAAGIVEIFRKRSIQSDGGIEQEVGGKIYLSANLGVAWQIPQFLLNGAGEVFTSITGLEFAYSQAPRSMRGLLMGVNLVTIGLGSLLGAAILAIVNVSTRDEPWLPDEKHNGHMERYMFTMATLLLINFIIYLDLSRRFQYTTTTDVSESVEFRHTKKYTEEQASIALLQNDIVL